MEIIGRMERSVWLYDVNKSKMKKILDNIDYKLSEDGTCYLITFEAKKHMDTFLKKDHPKIFKLEPCGNVLWNAVGQIKQSVRDEAKERKITMSTAGITVKKGVATGPVALMDPFTKNLIESLKSGKSKPKRHIKLAASLSCASKQKQATREMPDLTEHQEVFETIQAEIVPWLPHFYTMSKSDIRSINTIKGVEIEDNVIYAASLEKLKEAQTQLFDIVKTGKGPSIAKGASASADGKGSVGGGVSRAKRKADEKQPKSPVTKEVLKVEGGNESWKEKSTTTDQGRSSRKLSANSVGASSNGDDVKATTAGSRGTDEPTPESDVTIQNHNFTESDDITRSGDTTNSNKESQGNVTAESSRPLHSSGKSVTRGGDCDERSVAKTGMETKLSTVTSPTSTGGDARVENDNSTSSSPDRRDGVPMIRHEFSSDDKESGSSVKVKETSRTSVSKKGSNRPPTSSPETARDGPATKLSTSKNDKESFSGTAIGKVEGNSSDNVTSKHSRPNERGRESDGSRNSLAAIGPGVAVRVTSDGAGGVPATRSKSAKESTSKSPPKEVFGRPEKSGSRRRGATPDREETEDVDVTKCLEDLRLKKRTAEGIKISVYVGDITQNNADVIVNAANGRLSHGGGVSKAIADAGGHHVYRESKEYVKKNGRLGTGQFCHTTAGKLPSKFIIHAVGPRWSWDQESQRQAGCILKNMFAELLQYAGNDLKVKSLASPAISTGTYGMPLDVGAKMLHEAIKEFSERKGRDTKLKDIRLVLFDAQAAQSFILEFSGAMSTDQPPEDADWRGESSAEGGRSTSDMQPPKKARPSDRPQELGLDAHGAVGGARPRSPALSTRDIAVACRNRGECDICTDEDVDLMAMKCCQNTFCRTCFERHFSTDAKCPFCTAIVLVKRGNQPKGTMDWDIDRYYDVPGHDGEGIIVIDYHFKDGTQRENHPNPGSPYSGTHRRAFLPAGKEGREILDLLKKAFDMKYLFTIGRSVTTGRDNCVVWNDIHHKTNIDGGAGGYGYPDPTYLSRVRAELAAKGIK